MSRQQVINNLREIVTSRSIPEVYQEAILEVKKIVPSERISIVLLDKDGEHFFKYFVDTSGRETGLREHMHLPLENSLVKKTVAVMGPVIIKNTSRGEVATDELLLKEGICSRMCYPLIYNEKLVGAFCFGSTQVDYFTEEHIAFLREVAPILSVLAENARLLKELGESEAQVRHYARNLERLVSERTRELDNTVTYLKKTQLITIHKLAELAEKRDASTGQHLSRMMNYSRLLAEELGLTEKYRDVINPKFIKDIYEMSPLHDIGKVSIPDAILLKRSGLTKDEFEQMKTHTLVGAEILAGVEFMEMGRNIALYHHERWDGRGYPHGLHGEEIPLEARIVTLVDVFDALTSRRCYKEPIPVDAALAIIEGQKGRAFEPEIVDAFLRRIDRFILAKEEYTDSLDL